MLNYKTIEEKAIEWNVSIRHVQNLCKNGRIEGVLKKAGVWLVPEDCINPTRKKNSENKYEFSGTKARIFDESLKLFKQFGFENVSMRTIAGTVGIKQAAIYNHFESKKDILDSIYSFCRYYFVLDRPEIEELVPILETGSLTDIIRTVWYSFNEKHKYQLSSAIKIVFDRMSIDEQANEIARYLIVEEGNRFAKSVFDRAVEIGRLKPFNTHIMGVFVNAIRIYTLINWLIDDSDEYNTEVNSDEQSIYEFATGLLIDLNPPVKI